MGSVADALHRRAMELGVSFLTEAHVTHIHPGSPQHTVAVGQNSRIFEVKTPYVLVNAAPEILSALLQKPHIAQAEDEGSVFKMNLLLKRLPRLKQTSLEATDAFAGTFHINQAYSQMAESYREAASGKLPATLPGEVYCHTLTDASILSPELARKGYHTLTLFGLDLPYRLFVKENDAVKQQVIRSYLSRLNSFLAEPLEDCLATDSQGNYCLEAKSPVDLEQEIGLPQGNIFHNALSWFFAEDNAEAGTWGVETDHDRIYLCGSGAKRGGAVSGIPGHNAAMKVLNHTPA